MLIKTSIFRVHRNVTVTYERILYRYRLHHKGLQLQPSLSVHLLVIINT